MRRVLAALIVILLVIGAAWVILRTPDGAIVDAQRILGMIKTAIGENNQAQANKEADPQRQLYLSKSRAQAVALCHEALDLVAGQEDDHQLLMTVAQTQALAKDGASAMEAARRTNDLRVLADVALILSVDASKTEIVAAFQPAVEKARAAETGEERAVYLAYVAQQQSQIDPALARETMNEAIAIASTVSDYASYTWAKIAAAQVAMKDIEGAAANIERVSVEGERPTFGPHTSRAKILVAIADVHSKAGDKQKAIETLSLATAAARQASENVRYLDLFDIASAQIELGEQASGRATLAETLSLARALFEDNEEALTGAMTGIAMRLAEAGDVPGALALAKEIPDKSEWAKAQAAIAASMKESNTGTNDQIASAIQEAIGTAKGISDHELRDATLLDIAGSQAAAGDVPGALVTARSIPDLGRKASALDGISKALWHAGDKTGAIAAAQEAIAIESKRKEGLTDLFRRDLSQSLADNGELKLAVETARPIEDKLERARALASVAVTLVQCDGVKCLPPDALPNAS